MNKIYYLSGLQVSQTDYVNALAKAGYLPKYDRDGSLMVGGFSAGGESGSVQERKE